MRGISNLLAIFLITISLGAWLGMPSPALGWALGLSPSVIEIKDGLRGSELDKCINVSYNGISAGEAGVVLLGATGQVADWIGFYDLDSPDVPIQRLTLPDGGNHWVIARIRIPETAANGTYTGTVYAETVPGQLGKDVEVGAAVNLKIPADIKIEVTGTQILTGFVERVVALDTEVNFPMRFSVYFVNTGNVIARPEIRVNITKDGEPLDSFTFDKAEVAIGGERKIIPVEWDTTKERAGDYAAHVEIWLGGKHVTEQDVTFKLMPYGTLTRDGIFSDLSYEGRPGLDTLLKVKASFANTGQADTPAKFVAEIFKDGALIDTIESQEIVVPITQSAVLTAYLKNLEPGLYEIKGHVNYGGKLTGEKSISLEVPSPQPVSSVVVHKGFDFKWLIAGLIALLVCLPAAGIVIYKGKGGKRRKVK